MTSFKEEKSLQKVFEHFELFFCALKKEKILFLNGVIRNLKHDNIGFVTTIAREHEKKYFFPKISTPKLV